jgi:hypothetical protein
MLTIAAAGHERQKRHDAHSFGQAGLAADKMKAQQAERISAW